MTEKLNLYRAVIISYGAFCEGAALLSVVIFFLTGKMELLVITVVLIIAMAGKIHQPGILINDRQLDWKEQQEPE